VNIDEEAKHNHACRVATQLDTALVEWVEKICQKTESDLTQLLDQAQTVKPSAMRLFVQRLCFLYRLASNYTEPNHPVKRSINDWFADRFQPQINAAPESVQAFLQRLPVPLLKHLFTAKLHVKAVANDDFWKLVDYVNKQQLAAAGCPSSLIVSPR